MLAGRSPHKVVFLLRDNNALHLTRTFILICTGIFQTLSPDCSNPLLMAVNYNGLLFFVVANLLTGTINMALDTKSLSSSTAFSVVTVYMFILSLLFLFLYWIKFSLKAFIWRERQWRLNPNIYAAVTFAYSGHRFQKLFWSFECIVNRSHVTSD